MLILRNHWTCPLQFDMMFIDKLSNNLLAYEIPSFWSRSPTSFFKHEIPEGTCKAKFKQKSFSAHRLVFSGTLELRHSFTLHVN